MSAPRALSATVIAGLVVMALSATIVSAVGLRRGATPVARAAGAPIVTTPTRTEVSVTRVLAGWDRQRAAAWAEGDRRRLRSLYVPGSVAGRRDVAMLTRWQARGLVVRDLRTQVWRLEVLRHEQSRSVVEVTDRIVGGIAVGTAESWSLPHDAPTTRRVVLRQIGDRWLVQSVRRRR